MGNIYKVGDRVVRKGLIGEGRQTGTIQTIAFATTWDVYNDESKRTERWAEEYFEPMPPTAPASQPAVIPYHSQAELAHLMAQQQGQGLGQQQKPQCACCAMHACIKAEYEQVEGRNRDYAGEVDSLKAHVRRLEVALDDSQRRGRR